RERRRRPQRPRDRPRPRHGLLGGLPLRGQPRRAADPADRRRLRGPRRRGRGAPRGRRRRAARALPRPRRGDVELGARRPGALVAAVRHPGPGLCGAVGDHERPRHAGDPRGARDRGRRGPGGSTARRVAGARPLRRRPARAAPRRVRHRRRRRDRRPRRHGLVGTRRRDQRPPVRPARPRCGRPRRGHPPPPDRDPRGPHRTALSDLPVASSSSAARTTRTIAPGVAGSRTRAPAADGATTTQRGVPRRRILPISTLPPLRSGITSAPLGPTARRAPSSGRCASRSARIRSRSARTASAGTERAAERRDGDMLTSLGAGCDRGTERRGRSHRSPVRGSAVARGREVGGAGGGEARPMSTTTEMPALRTRPRPDRLTTAAGWSLLAICVLHMLAFSLHPYRADWLAGPLRTTEATLGEAAQFWGLPGGFVLPGILLAVLLIRLGRQGGRAPAAFGPVLGLWALGCVWILGPSGFLFV